MKKIEKLYGNELNYHPINFTEADIKLPYFVDVDVINETYYSIKNKKDESFYFTIIETENNKFILDFEHNVSFCADLLKVCDVSCETMKKLCFEKGKYTTQLCQQMSNIRLRYCKYQINIPFSIVTALQKRMVYCREKEKVLKNILNNGSE